MSTKITVASEKGYHLYTECYDPARVWLRLDDDPEFRLITEQAGGGGGIGSGPYTSLTVAIPTRVWKRMVRIYARAHGRKKIRPRRGLAGRRLTRRFRRSREQTNPAV